MLTHISLRRRRRTKIVATLGPASSTPEVIERLFRAGADVFRLNFSHGTHADHAERIAIIRALEEKVGRPIGILADVQGPKLRVGRFQGGRVQLQTGQPFRLDLDPTPGDVRRVQLAAPGDHRRRRRSAPRCCSTTASCGCAWYACASDHLETEVVVGGPLSDRKGVNVPDVALPIPALTVEGPRGPGLRAGARHRIYRAVSFVQRPEDVAEARD